MTAADLGLAEQILVDALVATGERLWSTAQSNTPSARRIMEWMRALSYGNFVLELTADRPRQAVDRVGELILRGAGSDCTIRTVDGRDLSWTDCWFVRIPRNQTEEREIADLTWRTGQTSEHQTTIPAQRRRNYGHARGPGYCVNLSVIDVDGEHISLSAAGDIDIETATMLRDGLSAWIADTESRRIAALDAMETKK